MIAVFVDIVSDVVLAVVWLGATLVALSAGWALAVWWAGAALRSHLLPHPPACTDLASQPAAAVGPHPVPLADPGVAPLAATAVAADALRQV